MRSSYIFKRWSMDLSGSILHFYKRQKLQLKTKQNINKESICFWLDTFFLEIFQTYFNNDLYVPLDRLKPQILLGQLQWLQPQGRRKWGLGGGVAVTGERAPSEFC